MSTGLIEIIKRSALEAVASTKPSDLRYGTVDSVSPLKVRVTNQFVLPESMLVVPEYLTDHEVEVSVQDNYGWATRSTSGGSEAASFASHSHEISFNKHKIKIHNSLKVGDKVILLREAGGQHFLIVDRLAGDKQ